MPDDMQAFIYRRYGGPEVLQRVRVPMPVPGPLDVLVRLRATTVTSADSRLRALRVPRGMGLLARLALGWRGPRRFILGMEFAGEVVAVGARVQRFRLGDAVFGTDAQRRGCHAEYKCLPQDGAMALIPPALTWAEAAALPFGGTTALDFLRRGALRAGERVLVNGASGAVGTAMVQLARHGGAEVTAVCSAANHALVRSLGAAHVVDPQHTDFARQGLTYHVVVDAVGNAPHARCRSALTRDGRLLLLVPGLTDLLLAPMARHHRVVAGPATERAADVQRLAELAQAGVLKPVIDHRCPFDQLPQAHAQVDSGRKRGNVVIEFGTR